MNLTRRLGIRSLHQGSDTLSGLGNSARIRQAPAEPAPDQRTSAGGLFPAQTSVSSLRRNKPAPRLAAKLALHGQESWSR